jgi:hypothetical protein
MLALGLADNALRGGSMPVNRRRLLFATVVGAVGLSGEVVGTRSAFQMRRELRRMVGFTIVASTSLQEIRESRTGSRYAVLADGSVFELQALSLALPLSDAVVFAKKLPPN